MRCEEFDETMASTVPFFEQSPQTENRRLHPRCRMGQLVYVACGSENGGILIDIAEGGLAFQGVGVLEQGQQFDLRLLSPAAANPLELRGEVVWLNSSSKGGGLRFVNMSDGTRQQVMEWIFGADQTGPPSAHPEDSSPVPEPVAHPAPATSPAFFNWETPSRGSPCEAEELPASKLSQASGTPDSMRPIERTPFLDSLRISEGAANSPVPKGRPICNQPEAAAQTEMQEERSAADGRIKQVVRATPPTLRPADPPERTTALEMLPAGPPHTVLGDPNPGGFGAFKLLLSAALGCAIVLIALFGMRAVRGATKAVSSPKQIPAALQPGNAGNAFHVQVVDGINQPWTLTMDKGTAAAPVENDPPPVPPPGSQKSVAKSAQPPIQKPEQSRIANPPPNAPHWVFHMPSPTKPPTIPGDSRVPAIADSSLSAEEPNLLKLHGMSAGVNGMAAPAVPAPAPPTPARIPHFQPAVLVERVAPAYSSFALQQHVEGVVEVNVTIGTDGVPKTMRVVHGNPLLAGSALTAIRRWRYRPALLDGKPAETQTQVQVEFRLKP
jgi:periplasmic protein TonB